MSNSSNNCNQNTLCFWASNVNFYRTFLCIMFLHIILPHIIMELQAHRLTDVNERNSLSSVNYTDSTTNIRNSSKRSNVIGRNNDGNQSHSIVTSTSSINMEETNDTFLHFHGDSLDKAVVTNYSKFNNIKYADTSVDVLGGGPNKTKMVNQDNRTKHSLKQVCNQFLHKNFTHKAFQNHKVVNISWESHNSYSLHPNPQYAGYYQTNSSYVKSWKIHLPVMYQIHRLVLEIIDKRSTFSHLDHLKLYIHRANDSFTFASKVKADIPQRCVKRKHYSMLERSSKIITILCVIEFKPYLHFDSLHISAEIHGSDEPKGYFPRLANASINGLPVCPILRWGPRCQKTCVCPIDHFYCHPKTGACGKTSFLSCTDPGFFGKPDCNQECQVRCTIEPIKGCSSVTGQCSLCEIDGSSIEYIAWNLGVITDIKHKTHNNHSFGRSLFRFNKLLLETIKHSLCNFERKSAYLYHDSHVIKTRSLHSRTEMRGERRVNNSSKREGAIKKRLKNFTNIPSDMAIIQTITTNDVTTIAEITKRPNNDEKRSHLIILIVLGLFVLSIMLTFSLWLLYLIRKRRLRSRLQPPFTRWTERISMRTVHELEDCRLPVSIPIPT